MLSRSLNNSNVLGLLFMLPAAILLLFFLAYPLGLGVWLGSTDTRLGNTGHWIGLGNYIYLMGDPVAQLALFNTIFYTVVAGVIKLGLCSWLVLMLNQRWHFKTSFRSDRQGCVLG